MQSAQKKLSFLEKPISWRRVDMCLIFSVVLGVAFVLFTLLVRTDRLSGVDFALSVKIQDKVPLWVDGFFSFFSLMAKFFSMLAGLIIILGGLRKWVALTVNLGLFGLAHLIEIIGKGFLSHPPPPFMFYRHPTEFVFPDLHVTTISSYPSGHSMRITFMVVLLIFLVVKHQRLSRLGKMVMLMVLIGVWCVTLFSRVSLGEHWSTDVIGGALLGACMAGIGIIVL